MLRGGPRCSSPRARSRALTAEPRAAALTSCCGGRGPRPGGTGGRTPAAASILYHECIVDDLNNLRLFFLPGFFLGKVVDGLLVMRKIEVKKKAILFNV